MRNIDVLRAGYLPRWPTRITTLRFVKYKTGILLAFMLLTVFSSTVAAGHRPDFDRDGITDLVVWRPSNGTWYVATSTGRPPAGSRWIAVPGGFSKQWGLPGDRPYLADFDGDLATDLAVVRGPGMNWYLSCSNTVDLTIQFGLPGDVFAFGDYWPKKPGSTGIEFNKVDGKDDFMAFRPTSTALYYRRSDDALVSGPNYMGGTFQNVHSILPLSQCVDSSYRQERIAYAVRYNNSGERIAVVGLLLGSNSTVLMDFAAPHSGPIFSGEYDGDGFFDVAVFHPPTAGWKLKTFRAGNSETNVTFGAVNGIPASGDFDGDGKHDLAVFDRHTMVLSVFSSGASVGKKPPHMNRSSTYVFTRQWGLSTDVIP